MRIESNVRNGSRWWRTALLALPLALGAGACADGPTAPAAAGSVGSTGGVVLQQNRPGTGLVLDNLTGVTVPILGVPLGDVIVDQAIITDLKVVEDLAGAIVGVEAEGVLQLTGGVLDTDVLSEDFSTIVGVTSTGQGRCDLVSIDLGPIAVEALDPLATVDVPTTDVTERSSGAVGPLLCNLGAILGAPGAAVQGLVNAINNLI
jgi:hypothetical protein